MLTVFACIGAGLIVIALLWLMVRLSPNRTLDPELRQEMDAQQARAMEASMYLRNSSNRGI